MEQLQNQPGSLDSGKKIIQEAINLGLDQEIVQEIINLALDEIKKLFYSSFYD